ncbi:hypothetical protein K523DRAFT_417240 [Schizophyllum commune Tattone D]|nr:hypothetical protein K523DRAFT_417240 [Schizophyllum commune Tattone D]
MLFVNLKASRQCAPKRQCAQLPQSFRKQFARPLDAGKSINVFSSSPNATATGTPRHRLLNLRGASQVHRCISGSPKDMLFGQPNDLVNQPLSLSTPEATPARPITPELDQWSGHGQLNDLVNDCPLGRTPPKRVNVSESSPTPWRMNSSILRYDAMEERQCQRNSQISPKFRLTCVNAQTPRKSVNALPSSPNVTDTGSSMILAASSFQAHDGWTWHQSDNVDNPRMLRKSVNDSVSSPNDAKTGKLNDFLDVASRAI